MCSSDLRHWGILGGGQPLAVLPDNRVEWNTSLIAWAERMSFLDDRDFHETARSTFPDPDDREVVLNHRSTMKIHDSVPIPDLTDLARESVTACDVPTGGDGSGR